MHERLNFFQAIVHLKSGHLSLVNHYTYFNSSGK